MNPLVLPGSESTANVGRGCGLPEAMIRVTVVGQPMQFGRFTITLYLSLHVPTGFTGGEITQPLKPPLENCDATVKFLGERGAQYQVDIRLPWPWAAMDVFSGL